MSCVHAAALDLEAVRACPSSSCLQNGPTAQSTTSELSGRKLMRKKHKRGSLPAFRWVPTGDSTSSTTHDRQSARLVALKHGHSRWTFQSVLTRPQDSLCQRFRAIESRKCGLLSLPLSRLSTVEF